MKKSARSRHIPYLAAAIALLTAFSALAVVYAQPNQAVTEDWRNSDYSFSSRMMDMDQNDNIYIVGDTVVGDYLIIKKFNPAGDLVWQTTYDPASRLRGVWIAVDNNNNPVVLASIISGSYGDPAGWLTLKYDTDGNLLWANSLSGAFSDARRVVVDGNNNIYVAGRMFMTNPNGNTTKDSVLIKYTPAGDTTWTAVFDNNGAVDEPFSMAISPDNSHIGVAGISGNMFMALMYDDNGSLLWSNTDPNVYAANDLAFGSGNTSYFATGTYFPQDPNPNQMAIAKFDATGNRLWVNSYSVGYSTYRVGVDGLGNVLATGIVPAGYIDWMTIKTDADGNLLWSRRYDGGRNNDEFPNMLVLDGSGAVYVTGTGGPNPSSGNISYLKGVVAKYNSDGAPQWAVYDDYAGGKAISLGAGNTLASLGFGYLVTTHYTETGLLDIVPAAPTDLSGYADTDGYSYWVNLYFTDNANNEFWVDLERCTGSGCSDFVKVGQTLGENAAGGRDRNVTPGVTYTYRARAWGFMGASDPSNAITVTIPGGLNTAPVLDLIGDRSVDELATLVFTATASDAPGQNLTFSMGAGAPDGVNINPGSGVFTWTPGEAQGPGDYPLTVIVTDDGNPPLTDAETFTVTVNEVNQTPLVNAGPDQSVQEGQPVQLNGAFTDTIQLGNSPAVVEILWDFGDGLSASGFLTPTHTYGDNGIFTVTLVVTDSLGSVGHDTLHITVANATPGLPVIPDQAIMINHSLVLLVAFADSGWLDSHTVTIEWAPGVTETLNLGAGVTDFTLEHTYTHPGQFTVTITIADQDGAFNNRTFLVTVDGYRLYLPQIQSTTNLP
jgi:hypothetical protein